MDPAQDGQSEPKNPTDQAPVQTEPITNPENNFTQASQGYAGAPVTSAENIQTPNPVNTELGQTAPQTPTLSENVIPATPETTPPAKPKRGFKIFMILLIFLILLISGASGFAYAVAYEKIKLDKYPDLQKNVSFFVIGLPFMPKTPKFLLAKSALAHQDVTKQSFDISMAIDSDDLANTLGLNQIDLQAKGAIDYSDPKNVKIETNVSITKDFNFEIKKKDKLLYFKINKLPTFLFAFMGLKTEQFDPILDKWISYDTTPLDTEARKQIQEDKKVDPLSEEFLDENFSKYIDEKVLSKMNLAEVSEDGFPMFKISLSADAELIDYMGNKLEEESKKEGGASLNKRDSDEPEKLSDVIKKLEWEIFIDKKDYYTRKIIITADTEFSDTSYSSLLMDPTAPSSEKQKMSIAFAAKSGDFGKDVNIEVPSASMTFEEFTDALSDIMQEVFGGVFSEFSASSDDARRKSDLELIRSALELYYADCGSYPSSLSDLSSKTQNCSINGGPYLFSLPVDPDGSNYFYQVSADKKSYDICALLTTPEVQVSACPDTSYNYHAKNP